MSTNQCVQCGRAMADQATICRQDALSLSETLLKAAGHAEDVWTVIARQARYGGGSRGGSSAPLPADLTASAKLAPIVTAIAGWARTVTEETGRRPRWSQAIGPLCPPTGHRCAHDSCEAIRRQQPPTILAVELAWLAQNVNWLRKHPAAKEAFGDLLAACYQLERLVDRPPDKELVGMCDCGKTLYAVEGRTFVTCPQPTCKLTWHVERSRDILRRNLGDKLVTLAEAARLAAYLDPDRTQDGIRKLLASRVGSGQLVAHGQVEGEPTYVFGEAVAVLAGIPKRRRETAEMGA
jgi:hypothetical protein